MDSTLVRNKTNTLWIYHLYYLYYSVANSIHTTHFWCGVKYLNFCILCIRLVFYIVYSFLWFGFVVNHWYEGDLSCDVKFHKINKFTDFCRKKYSFRLTLHFNPSTLNWNFKKRISPTYFILRYAFFKITMFGIFLPLDLISRCPRTNSESRGY